MKFSAPRGLGFRLVHFAVLSNHVHFVVEADSKRALSMGMQKLLHSISRRLNALSVHEHGGRQSTKAGSYSALRGWLGRVFKDRYHAHLLKTPTEMQSAIRYLRNNAERHYAGPDHGTGGAALSAGVDPFSSFGDSSAGLVTRPRGFLLERACRRELERR